jgi:protein gp37
MKAENQNKQEQLNKASKADLEVTPNSIQQTKIHWTNATVNFWTGCQKVSEGCKYCYMYRDKERYKKDPRQVMRTNIATFYQALRWKEPRLIFTCSWSDFFIKDADPGDWTPGR